MFEQLSFNQKNSVTAAQSKNELGKHGEDIALNYLISRGYRIVLTNFRAPIGRNNKGVQITGEIDIIALDRSTLCFVEVKARSSDNFAPVLASINARKQRQIIRTAKVYRRLFSILDHTYRFDAVTVLFKPSSAPDIELIKDFWNESKFRKKHWKNDAIY